MLALELEPDRDCADWIDITKQGVICCHSKACSVATNVWARRITFAPSIVLPCAATAPNIVAFRRAYMFDADELGPLVSRN